MLIHRFADLPIELVVSEYLLVGADLVFAHKLKSKNEKRKTIT